MSSPLPLAKILLIAILKTTGYMQTQEKLGGIAGSRAVPLTNTTKI